MDSPLPFLINVMNEAYTNIGGTGELLSGSRRLHVELLMKSQGITSWRALDTRTSSTETSDKLQHVLYNNVMSILWAKEKDGDHPLLPFIAHIIGLTPLCVAKRVSDIGRGQAKAAIEYFRLFHDKMFQAQWVDEMN